MELFAFCFLVGRLLMQKDGFWGAPLSAFHFFLCPLHTQCAYVATSSAFHTPPSLPTHNHKTTYIMCVWVSRCDLAHMQHALPYETGGIGAQIMRVIHYVHFARNKFRSLEYHTFILCYAFNHIWLCFSLIFDQTQSLHDNHNVQSRLQHSFRKFLNIKSHTHFHMYYISFAIICHIWHLKNLSIYLGVWRVSRWTSVHLAFLYYSFGPLYASTYLYRHHSNLRRCLLGGFHQINLLLPSVSSIDHLNYPL